MVFPLDITVPEPIDWTFLSQYSASWWEQLMVYLTGHSGQLQGKLIQ